MDNSLIIETFGTQNKTIETLGFLISCSSILKTKIKHKSFIFKDCFALKLSFYLYL